MRLILSSSWICVCLLVPSAAIAQPADATGRWDVTFNTPQGPMNASITLKKQADKLAGTLAGPQGDIAVEGSQNEKSVSLNFVVDFGNGGPISVVMSGVQDGEAMSGSFDYGGGQGDWSAARAAGTGPSASSSAGAKPDVSGTWALQVTTDSGSGSPSATLKQEGETLSGEYSGQFGKASLAGTVKGAEISFAVDLSIQGNAVHVVYSGTVEGDGMKGKVDFGGVQGTFTGTRQK